MSCQAYGLFTLASLVGLAVMNLIVFGDRPWTKLPPEYSGLRLLQVLWIGSLAVGWLVYLVQAMRPLGRFTVPAQLIWIPLASLVGSVGVLGLLFKRTRQFNTWGYEDQIVENFSFAFLILASILFLLYLFYARNNTSRLLRSVAALGAIGCFLLAMEEISWFQRVLDVDADGVFEGNAQNETNVHNFATLQLEMVLYSASTALLVGGAILRKLPNWSPLAPILPPYYLAMAMVPMTAMTYENWNQPLVQASLGFGIVYLVSLVILGQDQVTRILAIALLCVTVALFVSIQIKGERFFRSAAATEWRELYIAAGLMFYAAHTFWESRSEQIAS